jgi:hypothetical protein
MSQMPRWAVETIVFVLALSSVLFVLEALWRQCTRFARAVRGQLHAPRSTSRTTSDPESWSPGAPDTPHRDRTPAATCPGDGSEDND